jgi:hypothetical protein
MRSRGGGNSDEFIREVDEAVRQDRWMAIWKQYGAYIIGAALAVVVGVAAGTGWRTYQENQLAANARRLADATALLADDKAAEAAAAFRALADSAGGGVGVVARLRAAEAEKQAGDAAAKIEILQGLSSHGDAPPLYQELAALLARQESFEETDAEAMINELDRAATPDSPWRASLLELKAIAQMKAAAIDEARATLETLLDDEATPANLARRASELLSALGGPLDGDNQTVSQNGAAPAAGEGEAAAGEAAE